MMNLQVANSPYANLYGGCGGGSSDELAAGSLKMAVAVDKNSQFAVKWAVDKLLIGVSTVTLIHVRNKAAPLQNGFSINDGSQASVQEQLELEKNHLFLPFRGFCAKKHVNVKEVVVEDYDVSKAIIDYITNNAISSIVLGAANRNAISKRFRAPDVPSTVFKGAPEFCTVYVVAKGRNAQVRPSTRPAPTAQRLPSVPSVARQPQLLPNKPSLAPTPLLKLQNIERSDPSNMLMRSPLEQGWQPGNLGGNAGGGHFDRMITPPPRALPMGRAMQPQVLNHTGYDKGSPEFFESADMSRSSPRFSAHENNMPEDFTFISNGNDFGKHRRFYSTDYSLDSYDVASSVVDESQINALSNQSAREMEAEMNRLRLELKQTMDMYNNACKEALTAKQKAKELHQWQVEEARKLEEARLSEETALAIAEMEKARSRAAFEAAEAAKRIAEMEAQKRMNAEMKAKREEEEKRKVLDALAHSEVRYRKYSIQEIEVATKFFSESLKIGEGGYGPVYQGTLDHTPVAIKVLRPDAAQGKLQFQQEVEVLSCIRHPNMVLLLGACPEYGCLVYEFMERGSLDDLLFRRGNMPSLPWQIRFKIAAEIATALLFLHQTKPEPLVHRDLKPANILLDHNFVSKISDVGLARLVPPSIADAVTQYRMTSTAGTFCYIDPEYQQTGMLGTKSDIYSLGVMLLQIVTARPAMGLTHHVERAIERGTFKDLLDPTVPDWPLEETLLYAKLALKCSELRKKDRPDLGTVILPQLNRLRELGQTSMNRLGGLNFLGHLPQRDSEEGIMGRGQPSSCSSDGSQESMPTSQASSTDTD